MATFVLVHGAWHGGWCWDRLAPELQARGHTTVTMDMPVSDATATFDDYAATVVAAMDAAGTGGGRSDGGDIVLVGHSLGSMVIPLVAAARPVAAVVFLCGLIPNFGGSPWDGAPTMAAPGVFEGLANHDDGSTTWPTVEAATNAFYGDCEPADAEWAFDRLRPQNPTNLWSAPYPLAAWPDAQRVSIACTEDAAVTIEFARFAARERLGVTPVELPGDHSPFLARPAALADALVASLTSP